MSVKGRLAVSTLLAASLAAPVRAQSISAQDLARARADLASRPVLSTVAPECLKPSAGGRVTMHGLNLGATQGGRSVVLSLGGRRLDAAVASWTNGEIDVDVRPFAALAPAEAAPIALEVRSEAGVAYPDATRQIHVCRTRFEQSVVFDMGLCGYSAPTLPYEVSQTWGTAVPESAPAAGPGRYAARMVMGEGTYTVRPKPVGGCPEGAWKPDSRSVVVSDATWQQTVAFSYAIPTRRVAVPASTITTFVRAALADASIHLNNYGPKIGKSYLKTNDAWVKFGPAAGGGTFPITIEEIRLDPPDPFGRILYYVHDVDSTAITFTHDAGHYHLGIAFANGPEAIKGEHEGAGISPSMAVNDAKLAVTLHFTPSGGPKPDVVVDGVVFSSRITGGCNVQIFDVCALVTTVIKSGLPGSGVPGLEQRVREALEDPRTRQSIGDAIWNGLDSPVGRLVISNAAGGATVSRLVRVAAASADGLEVEFVPGR